jgi:hypothetical protein
VEIPLAVLFKVVRASMVKGEMQILQVMEGGEVIL